MLARLAVIASISSPPTNVVHVGPLTVHVYGLLYAVALVVAVVIVRRRWVAGGGDPRLPGEVAMWAFPAGLVGGRLYFLATSWGQVPSHWWGPLAVWRGGLGIWGGIAGGTLAGVLVLRRRGVSVAAFLDAAAPALLVAQAIGRVGNYFNQELFGGPTSLPWGLSIDPSHRPPGYERYATFHPTFLYELLFDLALAAGLVALGRTGRIRPPGLFALYVMGYSAFRIFEELLRVDPAHHLFGLRLNFYVAVSLTIAGLIWFARTQRGEEDSFSPWRGGALLAAALATCSIVGCGRAAHAPNPEAALREASKGPASGQLVVSPSSWPETRPRRQGFAGDHAGASDSAQLEGRVHDAGDEGVRHPAAPPHVVCRREERWRGHNASPSGNPSLERARHALEVVPIGDAMQGV